jgi:hypothetical protein
VITTLTLLQNPLKNNPLTTTIEGKDGMKSCCLGRICDPNGLFVWAVTIG